MRRAHLAFLLCAACAALLPAGFAGQKNTPHALTPAEQKLFEMTNRERKKNGVPPLKLNLVLCQVARAHSENMARQGKLAHKLDGKDQFVRIKGAGYRFRFAGENVGRGNKDSNQEDVLEALVKSPEHRANILKKEYTEIGVGIAYDGKDFTYYTQDFAKPRK